MSNDVTTTELLAAKRKTLFLRKLAQTGKVITAARAIGFENTSTLYQWKENDEEFSAAWDRAILASADLLEEAAWDRAVNGVEKPILYKGEVVATEVQYSDAVLLAMLAARKKEYRKATQATVDVDVNVNAKVGVAVIPMTVPAADWEKQAALVQEQQRQLPAFDNPAEGEKVETTDAGSKAEPVPAQREIGRA